MAKFRGTSGDDTLTGGPGNDIIIARQGGNDTIDAGDGRDIIEMGASLTADDHIDGGAGLDRVILNGDYSAGLTFAAGTMINVEQLVLKGGHDYTLTMNDGNVAAGEELTVNGAALGASDHLVFDGSAEMDGHYLVYGGAGNDTLTGGANSDVFSMGTGGTDTVHGGGGDDSINMGSAFIAADTIDGGTGTDKVFLNGLGDDAVDFTATTMTNVEMLYLGAGHDYTMVTNDATVASGATLTVNASALGSGDELNFNGSAEQDGAFIFVGGGSNQITLTGGAGNDVFDMKAIHDFANTTLNGGGGNDTFQFLGNFDSSSQMIDGGTGVNKLSLDGDYSAISLVGGVIDNIQTVALLGGHSYTGFSIFDDVTGGGALTIDASRLLSGDLLSLDATHSSDSIVLRAGDGTYNITGSALADQLNMGAHFSATDTIDGGAGSDTLSLNGVYSSLVTLSDAHVTHVETLSLLNAANSYNIAVTGDISGTTLAINANGAASLTADLTAATSSSYAITGSAGNDSVSFGANFAGTFDGGGGDDTLNLTGSYTTLVLDSSAGITNLDNVTFGGASSVIANFSVAGDITGGKGALTVDFSAAQSANTDFSLATSALHITGSSGDDRFGFGGAFNASTDTIDGGAGNDTLVLNGDYSVTQTFGASTLTNVDTIQFGPGAVGTPNSYFFVDSHVTGTLSLDASLLSNTDILSFDASGSSGNIDFTSGAQGGGIDTGLGTNTLDFTGLVGTASQFVFIASNDGGTNTLTFTDNFSSAAIAIGGSTDATTILQFDGDYSGTSFSSANHVNEIDLNGAHTYSFSIDNALANTGTFTLDASGVTAGGSSTIDFTGLSGIGLDYKGGADADDITLNDLPSSIQIDGGAGSDSVTLVGNFLNFTFGATTMLNVETLNLQSGGAGANTFDLTMNDATVAAGETLTVDASALRGIDSMHLDATAETNGFYHITGGAGDDTVTFGSQYSSSDIFHGGTGHDTLGLDGDYSAGLTFDASALTSIEDITVAGGNSYNLTSSLGNFDAGATVTIDASALGFFDSLTFDGSAETGAHFAFIGGGGSDILTGGALSDTFDLRDSSGDIAKGGGGDDSFTIGAPSRAMFDEIDGGTGTNTLILNGNFGDSFSTITFTDAQFTNLQDVVLGAGHSYDFSVSGDIANGSTLSVDASATDQGATVDFSAATSSGYHYTGSTGADTVYFAGNFSASDQINGNGDATDDFFQLNGDYTGANALVFHDSTLTGFDYIRLADGGSYDLTFTDATITASTVVDATELGSTHSVTLDDTAETSTGLTFAGGAGDDIVRGGAGDDNLEGNSGDDTLVGNAGNDFFDTGAGNDTLTGGAGADTFLIAGATSVTFIYNAVSDSTADSGVIAPVLDTIESLNFDSAVFDVHALTGGHAITAIDPTRSGTIIGPIFGDSLSSDIGSNLGAYHALLFSDNSAGHTYLVVDVNGVAGFQAGQDLVIDVTGYTGTLTTGDFT